MYEVRTIGDLGAPSAASGERSMLAAAIAALLVGVLVGRYVIPKGRLLR